MRAQRIPREVIEENLHESVRGFRTHLSAFLLAPEDSETVAHLWRLAKHIGKYSPGDRKPQPEPPPAYVESAEAMRAASAPRIPVEPDTTPTPKVADSVLRSCATATRHTPWLRPSLRRSPAACLGPSHGPLADSHCTRRWKRRHPTR